MNAARNYFGEHLTKDCGYCDVCQNPPKYVDGTVIAQKVCSAVARVKEQEGVTMIVDVLRGAKNAQVFDKGYQHIKTYGAINNVSWNDLQQYIIQLINLGVLEVYFHENGRLVLTPLAKAILFEGQNIQLAHTEDVKALKDAKTTKVTKNDSLFEQLRNKRSAIAAEKNVPAYIIFSDASLKDMIKKQPTTIEAFADISGVGKAKLESYAKPFIDVIKTYKAQQKPKVDTYQQTLQLYTQGMPVEDISKERDLSLNTIYSHLLKLHLEDKLSLNLNEFVTDEELSKVKTASKTLNHPEGLKPYYLHFEETIPYWKLKFALTMLEHQEK